MHRQGTVAKPVRDHRLKEVEVQRYKCISRGRSFRDYPARITPKSQSQRTVVLAALMYGLGLSCSAASHLLGALGAEIAKMSVWRDAQEAGEALRRKRPAGKVRVLGADETVYKVKGREVVVGFVVDAASGRTLGFEVLFEGDGQAFREWLEPYAEEFGGEVLVSDDNDSSYSVAAAESGLDHQPCIAHVRKYVAKRSKSILEQAKKEGWEADSPERLAELERDLTRVRQLVEDLRGPGEAKLGRMHRRYLWAQPPKAKEKASAGYRMRMLTLELWNKWVKLLLYLRKPELEMEGLTTPPSGPSARARCATRRCAVIRA